MKSPSQLTREVLQCCRLASKRWVCFDTKGDYFEPKNVARELKIACEKAGVKVVSPHDLRHTFISLMDNEVRAPRMVTMAIVGHPAKTMTDGYSHVTNQQIFEWLEKYMKQMSTACNPKSETTITKTAGSN